MLRMLASQSHRYQAHLITKPRKPTTRPALRSDKKRRVLEVGASAQDGLWHAALSNLLMDARVRKAGVAVHGARADEVRQRRLHGRADRRKQQRVVVPPAALRDAAHERGLARAERR